ncbi:GNAT family N-acetyltransferase [Ensifer sp.]|jgi:GNAT superfamily N-acetyltransferase|uniref:GNAT family N-acetyltransferase n=1 Tax=Ensifer sp. TaxID=1872086 RepID=UPI002E10A06B|nr:GNAT family N-acetyltransferase [Ensifer sp.]
MIEISNLKTCPHWADTIADRAWNAWWTDTDVSLEEYRAHLDPMIEGNGIPFALVAHSQGLYLGSVFVVESDLDERPQFAPWIAALWVEAHTRRQAIAATLMAAARQEASELGHGTCYLCASPENSPYYLARGFEQFESDVSGLNLFAIGSAGDTGPR